MAKRPARQQAAPFEPGLSADHVRQAPGDAVAARTQAGPQATEEDIRMRAYQKFLERGANHGRDFDDWLAAERELSQAQ
jgi:hypothetical protein